MPENRYNLLVDEMIGVRLADGTRRKVTLPEVLALLSGESEIESFTALQLHQTHAWHAFLVQVAAIALNHAGRREPWGDAEEWRTGLRALTDERDEPWCLVVSDLSRPAFMQPPVPEGTLEGFKELSCPDTLDVLVTAKNHDVKAARIGAGEPEHWSLALVSLQTMQGVFGAGKYGIARMNSGYGSRPCVALAPSFGIGERFRHDLEAVLHAREEIGKERYRLSGGKALLWLEPWDGTSSLPVGELDPLFIESCRRVRLEELGGRLVARTIGSDVARVAAKELLGNTGDAWTPVSKDGKALTVPGSGFSYALTQELLVGSDFKKGAAQQELPSDPVGKDLLFLASVLTRGQGKTEGFHQRALPIPGRIRLKLTSEPGRLQLGSLAKRRVDLVGRVRKEVLYPAIHALLDAGEKSHQSNDNKPRRWLEALDAEVDSIFFTSLFEDVELEPAEADARWVRRVFDLARVQLEAAKETAPLPSARRYRAFAVADRVFFTARKKFVEYESKGESA